MIPAYPRAFDLVLAEALYGTAPFFNFPLARHKHVRVVLQDDRRNLYQDAAGLFDRVAPAAGRYRSRQCWWWDFPDAKDRSSVPQPVVRLIGARRPFFHSHQALRTSLLSRKR